LWREAHFEVKSAKNNQKTEGYGALFGRLDAVLHGRRLGLCKSEQKRQGFVAVSKRWQAWDI